MNVDMDVARVGSELKPSMAVAWKDGGVFYTRHTERILFDLAFEVAYKESASGFAELKIMSSL